MPVLIWPSLRENMTLLHANNKGPDQSVHPCNLISAFVIHSLDGMIAKVAHGQIQKVLPVGVQL